MKIGVVYLFPKLNVMFLSESPSNHYFTISTICLYEILVVINLAVVFDVKENVSSNDTE